jgi:hypothetical protein
MSTLSLTRGPRWRFTGKRSLELSKHPLSNPCKATKNCGRYPICDRSLSVNLLTIVATELKTKDTPLWESIYCCDCRFTHPGMSDDSTTPSKRDVGLPRHSTMISLSSIDTEYPPSFSFWSIKYTISALVILQLHLPTSLVSADHGYSPQSPNPRSHCPCIL